MEICSLFVEIAQQWQQLRCSLNFVKEKQGFTGDDFGIAVNLQKLQTSAYISTGKKLCFLRIFVKINFNQVVELISKFSNQPRFADLSSSPDNDRLPVRAVLPVDKVIQGLAIHLHLTDIISRSTKIGIVFIEDYTQKWTKEKVVLCKKGFSIRFV